MNQRDQRSQHQYAHNPLTLFQANPVPQVAIEFYNHVLTRPRAEGVGEFDKSLYPVTDFASNSKRRNVLGVQLNAKRRIAPPARKPRCAALQPRVPGLCN